MFETTELTGVIGVVVPDVDAARRDDRVARGDGPDDFVGRQAYARSRSGSTLMTMVRWLPPNGGGDETPGERREHRAHAIECEVLDLAQAARVAREDKITDRHAARIEAHDEGRTVPGGMKARARLTYADRLRERLAHVRAGMKRQLEQRRCPGSTSTRRSRCH